MTTLSPEDMTLEARPAATPKEHHLTPEMMTLEEIKEQLALYNRLYYQKGDWIKILWKLKEPVR